MTSLSFFYFVPSGLHPMYWVLMIAGIVIALGAQAKVRSAFARFEKVRTRAGLTGAQVAQMILDARGIRDVQVEETQGFLGDHYDPREKKLRLSRSNYHGSSVSAVGVAAHEVGHAIQHADNYSWLQFRSSLVPVVGFGSKMASVLVMVGMILLFVSGKLAVPVLTLAAIGMLGAVLFSLVTLPVEIDASMRAVRILGTSGILQGDELNGAKTVLRAAAYTYVAAAAVAIIELIKLVMIIAASRNN